MCGCFCILGLFGWTFVARRVVAISPLIDLGDGCLSYSDGFL